MNPIKSRGEEGDEAGWSNELDRNGTKWSTRARNRWYHGWRNGRALQKGRRVRGDSRAQAQRRPENSGLDKRALYVTC